MKQILATHNLHWRGNFGQRCGGVVLHARAQDHERLRALVRTFGLLSYRYRRTRWFGNRGGRGRWPQAARGCPGVYVTQIQVFGNGADVGADVVVDSDSGEIDGIQIAATAEAAVPSRGPHSLIRAVTTLTTVTARSPRRPRKKAKLSEAQRANPLLWSAFGWLLQLYM